MIHVAGMFRTNETTVTNKFSTNNDELIAINTLFAHQLKGKQHKERTFASSGTGEKLEVTNTASDNKNITQCRNSDKFVDYISTADTHHTVHSKNHPRYILTFDRQPTSNWGFRQIRFK